MLREAPRLDVGVHLTFVGRTEYPASPASEVRSLLSGATTQFLPGWGAFLARYLRGGIDLGELEREARRQIDRVAESGLQLTHLDSHQHLHALPAIFDVVCALAVEYGIPYVRLPLDTGPVASGPVRGLAIRALARLARGDRVRVPAALRTNGRAIGIGDAGHLTAERLVALLERVEGVTELVSHPGEGDREIASRFPWRYEWDAEREALCDPRVREKIAAEGITLGGVRELP